MKYKDFHPEKAKNSSVEELAKNAMILERSFKNREGLLPIGTRVSPTYDRISPRKGTVVEYSEDGERMVVIWDGNEFPSGDFSKPEIRRIDEGNNC